MRYFIILVLLFYTSMTFAQESKMRALSDLVNLEEPGWELVKAWLLEATNEIEILEKDSTQAADALYRTQVTTRSPMGAIIYESGGILVEHGWIRILGSGSTKLKRNLPEWNKGKSFENYGEAMSFLLIADDAIGGFFAINGGAFGAQDEGKLYYLSPDKLEWEPLGIGYSEFIFWTFTGDIAMFYEGLRWENWEEEIKKMECDKAMSFYPFLWTSYDDLEALVRKEIPIEEMWIFKIGLKN